VDGWGVLSFKVAVNIPCLDLKMDSDAKLTA
jgi:hypothetical protein